MTNQARKLLTKMTAEYEASGSNSFDSYFYMSVGESVVDELENYGFIIRKNNILGSIMLTNYGYEEAKNLS